MNLDPFWEIILVETKIDETYIESFTRLILNQHFSLYIEAKDTQKNTRVYQTKEKLAKINSFIFSSKL